MALIVGGVAVDATAAEIDVLDGLDRGSIIYGNASSVTTVLDQGNADEVLTSDGTDIAWAEAGGGISHDGSTADGVLTYKDADEATVESGLTFGTAGLVQETNVIRKLIVSSETENTTATIFTINTTNPGAYTRYGAYSCTMHTIIGHCINCNPTATLALTTQFAHVNADSGGASTTAVVELGKTAQCGNDTGMRGIGTVTMGASNSGNYAVNVTLNADLTGTHAAASYTQKTLVELVWTGYVNAPTFS